MNKNQFFQIVTPQLLLNLPTGFFRLRDIQPFPQAHCGPWFWEFISSQGSQFNIRVVISNTTGDSNLYEKY